MCSADQERSGRLRAGLRLRMELQRAILALPSLWMALPRWSAQMAAAPSRELPWSLYISNNQPPPSVAVSIRVARVSNLIRLRSM